MPGMTKAGYRPESVNKRPGEPAKKSDSTGKKKKRKRKNKLNPAAVASLAVFMVALMIGVGTLYVFKTVESSAEVFAIGQRLSGHPLGGLTAQEGSALLAKLTQEKIADWRFDVTCLGNTYSVTAEDIGLFIDERATLEPLWQVGKTGGMIERFTQLMQARTLRENAEPVFGYVMEPVDALLTVIEEETECLPVEATVRFVPGNSEPFRFTDDQAGYALDTSALRAQIEQSILSLTPGSSELKPEKLEPAVTRAALENAISLRARVTAVLDSDAGALTNVKLAAGMINGLRVEAGEKLSFNEVIGKRTAEGGYVSAPEPAYGEGIAGVGGGVCQLSTALYRAALLAGLPVEERSAAVSPVSYCDIGQEAVVSDQGLDLKIVNSTQTPLFITTRVYTGEDGDVLEVQLIGEPLGARYALVSHVTQTAIPEDPVYVRDSEGVYATYTDERVPVGEGVPGYSVVVERAQLDENGVQLSAETVSQNEYEPLAPTVYVGIQVR